jgi:hypothetical protein
MNTKRRRVELTDTSRTRIASSPVTISSGIRLVSLDTPADPHLDNIESYSLNDLIKGDWRSMWQFNYCFDFDWFMDRIPNSHRGKAMYFVVHKSEELAMRRSVLCQSYPNVKILFPDMYDRYGTHHTKS